MSLKHVLVTGAAALLAVAMPMPAFAAAYPPGDSVKILIDTMRPQVGDEVTLSLSGLKPTSEVRIEVTTGGQAAAEPGFATGGGRVSASVRSAVSGTCATGSECTALADGSGTVDADVAITRAGATTITVSGVDANDAAFTKTMSFSAVAPADAAAGEPALTNTGAESVFPTIAIGALVIAVGAGLVLVVRRRRDAHQLV
jgi:LPXTG-motif cell wall-anchored protein